MSETYNNNIYAQENNTTDDWITRLGAAVNANSDWNNHALNMGAFVEGGLYADNSDEDYTDYGIIGDGRIDVSRAANLFGGASAAHLHDDRGTPDATVGAQDPTEFDRFLANAGATYKPNRLGVTGEVAFRRLDYENGNFANGLLINNDDRDRDRYTERLRVGYDVQPGYTAFIQGSLNQREYDTTPDDNGFNRDSDGWRVDTGLEVRLTGKLDGEVYLGYLSQDYEDPLLENVDEFDFGGALTWAATQLTSVKATVFREALETTTPGASAYMSTLAQLDIDHELMRNVLVGGSISYTNNDYIGITRDDDLWSLAVRGKYLINRNFFAGADMRWVDRDSNVVGQSYDQFRVGAFVGAQF